MPNPAELLHAQLTTWSNGHQQTVIDSRGLDNSKTKAEVWSKHRIAIKLLSDVEEALQTAAVQGYDVEVFQKYIPQWTEAVFAFPGGWNTYQSPAVLAAPMDQLKSASSLLSAMIPSLEPSGGKEHFSDFLSALAYNVKQLDEQHKFLKEHSLRIIRHLEGCLKDVETFGEFRITNALEDLRLLLDALDEAANGTNPFFKNAKTGVWSFFTQSGRLALVGAGIVAGAVLDSAGADFYEEIVKPEFSNVTKSISNGASEELAE